MRAAAALMVLLLSAAFAGCIGATNPGNVNENASPPPGAAGPVVAKLPDVITGIEHAARAEDVPTGAGIWLEGGYAYVSALGDGFYVVNVSDPMEPKAVGSISGDEVFSRDVDLLKTPDGRLIATLATQTTGLHLVDVTDPANPEVVSTVLQGVPNHNVAVVPGTTLVYNSRSNGQGGGVDIVDAADPENPEVVHVDESLAGCHDITFHMPDDRAFCPGVDVTEIWDISDPAAPKLVSSITNPAIYIHHLALAANDGDLLIIGDEWMGGGGPGCFAHASLPVAGDVSDPVGALWFYDISDEENPRLISYLAPPAPVDNAEVTSCTSHFGTLIGDRPQLVMSWYGAGVLLVDFSDPGQPRIQDQWNDGTDTWDARVHNGHLFTGDMNRGLDVLTFVGDA